MLPFELTKDTPYLALSGELWSVFYEYFNRNRSCYKGFLLYSRKLSDKRRKVNLIQSLVFISAYWGVSSLWKYMTKYVLNQYRIPADGMNSTVR